MDLNEQRRHLAEIAKQLGATKTLARLENKDACYEEILTTAEKFSRSHALTEAAKSAGASNRLQAKVN